MTAYGNFCEDIALEIFIDATLVKFQKGKMRKHDEFAKIHVPVDGSDSMIEKRFVDVSKEADLYDLELFIVARDYDNQPIAQYPKYLKERKFKLDIRVRNKTVFCIPVKCVEYWLFYVKHMDDTTPPQPNSLESDTNFNCAKAKSDVYERPLDEDGKYIKQAARIEVAKAIKILEKLDIKRLKILSPSYDNFIGQLQKVKL